MFEPSKHLIQLPKRKKDKTGRWVTINTDYLEVKWRVVWFREEKSNWGIETEAVSLTDEKAIFRCAIKDEQGRIIATGYGSETLKDFGDYIEKAETKSIGRALAYLGYGTQFAPELDEGDRIVDSPVERGNMKTKKTSNSKTKPKAEEPSIKPLLKAIIAEQKRKNISDGDLQSLMIAETGKEHSKDMTLKDAQKLYLKLKNIKGDEQ